MQKPNRKPVAGAGPRQNASAKPPQRFEDVEQLDAFLSQPDQMLMDDLAVVDGDILILGVGGKMGPTLARLARNAAPDKRIIGVARFSEPSLRDELERAGIETIVADLLDAGQVEALPRVKNVIFMGAIIILASAVYARVSNAST